MSWVALAVTVLACAPRSGPVDSDSGIDSTGPWTVVAAGEYFSVGLDQEGRVYCWGSGNLDVVADCPDLVGQRHVMAQDFTACTYDDDRRLSCWGNPDIDVPESVEIDYSFDGREFCLLQDDGSAECTRSGFAWPVALLEGPLASLPEYSDMYLCGITDGGDAQCGPGGGNPSDVVTVPGPFSETNCAHDQCCAISADADLVCDMYDQDGASGLFDRMPSTVSGPWTQLGAEGGAFCALDDAGFVTCWPLSETTAESYGPDPGTRFTQVEPGRYHACGVTVDGQIECWGRNDSGQTDVPEL